MPLPHPGSGSVPPARDSLLKDLHPMSPSLGVIYDHIAPIYDATRGWPPEVAAQIGAGIYDLLAPAARPGAPLRVLEVGAGTGRALAPLVAQGAWGVGLDVS